MRKIVGSLILMALVAALAALLTPSQAQAGGRCIVRCDDLHGCVRCCNGPGGWVCGPA